MSDIVPFIPDHLEPKPTKQRLLSSVRTYFYTHYNATSPKFRDYLRSVDNKTAVTGNRVFDRKEAVDMIIKLAEKSGDDLTANSKPGAIYKCLVEVMGDHGELKLSPRRLEYQKAVKQAKEEAATAQPQPEAAD